MPKEEKTKEGKLIHYSAAAIIQRDNKYLLIDRAVMPFGFACPAGHIEEGEDEVQALYREIEEETGLKITKYELVIEEYLDWNCCSKGSCVHYWYVFKCNVTGKINRNLRETKSIGWYTVDEIKKLKLEPVWEYWLKKLNII